MELPSLSFGAAVSTIEDTARATREAAARAVETLDLREGNLGFVFFTPHHGPRAEEIAQILLPLSGGNLVGCTAEAVLAEGQEIEDGPAISVWLANFPGVKITRFSLSIEATPDGNAMVGFPLLAEDAKAALLVADPWSFPLPSLLEHLNRDHPGFPIVGGMASGAGGPGENVIIDGASVRTSGGAGVILSGPVNVETVVSQGCRPIGEPYVITAAEGNLIKELGSRTPVERLQRIIAKLPPEEQEGIPSGLHVGILVNETADAPARGDFLVRNIAYANLESGEMAVGDLVEVGQVMQFQVRDPQSAHLNLEALLVGAAAEGALMFTCNGRGIGMFGIPHHDVATLEGAIGPVPVSGMFCAGEVGPVGGKNFLHGFTASIALFSKA